MNKIKKIGIIAEDESDFEAASILVKRIIKKDNIGFKRSIGRGCGRMKRKCFVWANNLKDRGCNLLIILHDLDRHNLSDLKKQLHESITPSPIKNHLICIPIEELEAWFLSDPNAIKKVFNLKREPKIKGKPETIKSPKEYLEDLVYLVSEKERVYINTKHNVSLAKEVSIDSIDKNCPSFRDMKTFLLTQNF